MEHLAAAGLTTETTMIDRRGRRRTARAIAWFMHGRIDNRQFDAVLFNQDTADQTLGAIHKVLWGSYDDLKRHKVSTDEQGWKAFRRCIAFLNTENELPARRRDWNNDDILWPFQSRIDIFAARPRLEHYALPRFNPEVHDVPIRGFLNMIVPWWIFLLLLVLLLSTFLLPQLIR